MPETVLTGFPAAATGVSASPPSKEELIQFTSGFVNGYRCDDDGLSWGRNKIVRVVLRFHDKFPHGSWVMFWSYLAWHISDVCDSKVARRMRADLYTCITYVDPTGNTAVRNVMRTFTS